METIQKSKTVNQESIDVLNNLVEINNDRIEGYERASKETDELDLRNLFSQLRETSFKCRQELAEEVTKLGGTPVAGTRTTGKFFRVWMDVKAAITNKNRKSILSSCEFGEDVAVKNYQDSLDKSFPDNGGSLHSLLKKQYALIKADHDKVRALRDAAV